MNRKLLLFLPFIIIPIQKAFATTCIESLSCPPTTPLEVFKAFDITYGSGMTLLVFALILGVVEMAIYLRTKSLAMLSVLGIYTIAAFGSIMLSPYISSQYHIAEYVIIMGAASAALVMILKLVKE